MHRAYQPLPPPPPSPPSPGPSRQNKVVLQREYREKEAECFNTLRDIIKDLTGVELRTRHEILRKAIDILFTASETRKQRGVQVTTLTAYEIHSPTTHEATTSHAADYSTQSPRFSQDWQPYADLDAASLYDTAPFHDQQYYSVSDMDSAPGQANSQGCGEDWSNYPQLRRTF